MRGEYKTCGDIREAFLTFFEGKGHKRVPSASLVPVDDPSLLLINAGMAPMKRYFEGREKPPAPRLCSCQKCIRTIDIDLVGRTNRHNTFFEMLGNFSFGDYFKEDAIAYCWEFLTSSEWMNLPVERLYSTVHESDDESYGYWKKVWRDAGFEPVKRTFRLGDKHNFWAAGETGPCGYDSEVFFDLAPDEPFGGTREEFEAREESGRFIEVWNNVFMEFTRDESGELSPLPNKNVDTGMGFERLVMIKQGLERGADWQSVFLSDLFDYIIREVHGALEVEGDSDEYLESLNRYDFGGEFERVVAIADYLRSSVFLLADGITPTNEGRGYVLRKLVRRAVQYGYGIRTATDPENLESGFLVPVAEKVIKSLSPAYPELRQASDKIRKYLAHEEASFLSLLGGNYDGVIREIERAKGAGESLSGKVAFLYHDTHGFPVDVTRDLCRQFGVELYEDEYEQLMQEQKERARAASSFTTDITTYIWSFQCEFVGYERLKDSANVKLVEIIESPEPLKGKYQVVTDATPFYAEGGGQPGDRGTIEADGVKLQVLDSKLTGQHICEVVSGDPASIESKTVKLTVDGKRRRAIARAHTATHLMHRALKDVLGGHVQQAGSQLDKDRFRFDFSHTQAMTDDEAAKVEELVTGWIADGHPVTTQVMPLEEAKALGITALFDEKYGERVRVVTVGTPEGALEFPHYPWVRDEVVSRELCGGTHVDRSSDIGGFTILREESVSAGMRRITAVTGREAWKVLQERSRFATRMKESFNLSYDEIREKVSETASDLKLAREKLIVAERGEIIDTWLARARDAREEIAGASAVMMAVDGVGRSSLKFLADRIASEFPDAVVLLGENVEGKAAFVCKVPPSLVEKGLKAGDIVKAAAQACGGGGGGRPDFAEAGGKKGENVPEGIEAARRGIEERIARC